MKLLQNLLLSALFLFLVACGGGDTTTEDTTEENTEETTNEETTEESTEETSEEAGLDLENEDVKMLINRWKMTAYTHTDGKKEEGIENAYLVLKEDGTFEELFNANVIASGSWSYDAEGKEISMIHETGELKGDNEKFTVEEISAEQMITKDDEGKMTETWVVEAEEGGEETTEEGTE